MKGYDVKPTSTSQAEYFIDNIHYSKRKPMSIEYCFGLYRNNICLGVCVFGPSFPTAKETVFNKGVDIDVKELTRLVTVDGLKRNVLSYFVAKCIKMLPKPLGIISYADPNNGHNGYIYQATNWYYTGQGGRTYRYEDKNGKDIHRMTVADKAKKLGITERQYCKDNSLKILPISKKHRYVYLHGSKMQKKYMLRNKSFSVIDYPKGDNKVNEYDSRIFTQTLLF